MQVTPVSNQSFGNQRQTLEMLANLDDKALGKIAFQDAVNSKEAKKERRSANRLIYSIPLAAGLSSVINNPIKITSKVADYSRSANMFKFGQVAGGLFGALLVFDGVNAVLRKITNKNKKAHDFAQKHPMIATLTGIGVAIGSWFAVNMGLDKLFTLAESKQVASTLSHYKALKSMAKMNRAINNSKVLNALSKGISKMPKSAKIVAAIGASVAPVLLFASSLMKSINASRIVNNRATHEFYQLKELRNQAIETLDAEQV